MLFAFDEKLGGAEDHLGAAGRGHQAPFGKGALGGIDGRVHIGFVGPLENADDFAGVGGIAVFEGASADGFDPFAVNEVLENFGFGRAAASAGPVGVLLVIGSLLEMQQTMLTPEMKAGKRGWGYVLDPALAAQPVARASGHFRNHFHS